MLGFALTLICLTMLATPIVGTVMAGKGQTKQDYEFILNGDYGPGLDTKIWTTEDGVMQIRDMIFIASYIEVKVGGVTYYPDPNDYSCTMDCTLNLVTSVLDIRVRETFVIDGIGTITQRTAETVTEYGSPDATGGGNFVGFGSEGLEGVKIKGTSIFVVDHPERVGTVMGWPSP